jgi:hypothetical protein
MFRDRQDISEFYNRPNDQVAPQMGDFWRYSFDHKDKTRLGMGENNGLILAIQTSTGNRLFRVQEVEAWSHEETMLRWPGTKDKVGRGPQIQKLAPSDVISYNTRVRGLTFTKTLEKTASNIWLARFQEVDPLGQPRNERTTSSKAFAELAGIYENGSFSQFSPLRLPRGSALLLEIGGRKLTPEQIASIEENLLKASQENPAA